MKTRLLFFVVLVLFSLPVISAKSSDIFIDYLSSKIYSDCQDKDIIIKENYIANSNGESINIFHNNSYDYSAVRKTIEIFGKYEPYEFFQGSCENKGVSLSGRIGCGILSCGNSKLDINQYTYFWNGERIDVPQETTNIAINNNGNLAQGLNNCNLEQKQIKNELNNCTVNIGNLKEKFSWYSLISNILISFLGSAVFYLLLYKHGDTRRKKKAIIISVISFILLIAASFFVRYEIIN